jgi:hypothetical protein
MQKRATELADYSPNEEEEEAIENGATAAELALLETEDEDELYTIISNLKDTVEVLLPIPEWTVIDPATGKKQVVAILVRGLDSEQRAQFLQDMRKVDFNLKKLYPDLVMLTALHPKTKKPVFKSAAAARGALNHRNGAAIERIATEAANISGLSEEFLESMKKK